MRAGMQTRRTFIKSAGLGVVASPTLLYATRKSGSVLPIVRAGEHTYEVIHDWGTLPANIRYGNTHGVCEDAQGQIYVHHTVHATSERPDTMVVFDENGRFVRSWGGEFKGGAHGLHIVKEGSTEYLYLCDTQRGVVAKTTTTGEIVWQLGYPKETKVYTVGADGTPTLKYSPTNVAIAPNDDVYVADGYGSSYINQYDANGRYIRTFGGPGKEAGQLSCPHGLIVDRRSSDPVLMVADRANNRIQVLTLDGKHVRFVEGTTYPCHFSEYQGMMVVPDLFARVTLIDRQNQVIGHLGDNGPESWKTLRTGARENFPAGKFVCPHSATFDRHGNIFVVEWVEVGRVTKLRKV
jgi:hypothetical protein